MSIRKEAGEVTRCVTVWPWLCDNAHRWVHFTQNLFRWAAHREELDIGVCMSGTLEGGGSSMEEGGECLKRYMSVIPGVC